MKTLKFYGSGDDQLILEINGAVAASVSAQNKAGCFSVESSSGRMSVYAIHSPMPLNDGAWVVGVTLYRQGEPLPPWPMRLEALDLRETQPCSPALVLEVPDDTVAINYDSFLLGRYE